jgi:putative tricarboxylic transport membrane protein
VDFNWITAFTPSVALTCLAGAALGVLWGAMPGLSVNMALALLIGITYSLPSELAVAFMLAVWVAGEFGGAIPAIMINIPGTPAAVPTQLAGRPLALRGKGGAAIGSALVASVLGGLAGVAFLVTVTPILTAVVLHMGSWEVFLLALLGIVLSGSVAAGVHPIKGWSMGLLGLLVSMVGQDPIHGAQRWTYDSPHLIGGVGFLPVMVGLLAVSEAIEMLSRHANSYRRILPGPLKPPPGLFARYWRSIVRSSLIGTLVGSMPGAGASIASFLSYSIGEKRSGKKFSDGDIDGVICGEVANNANVGGGLIPAATLGIPGNNAAALFMAALTLHGVVLSPTVQQDHPGFLGYAFSTLLVANIALLVSAPLTIRAALAWLTVPTKLLMPLVLVLAVYGTYAASNSLWDVYVMFAAGVAGYVLKLGGFPLAPIVLGILLGPVADENLRRAMLITEGEILPLLSRPAGDLLLLVLVGVVVFATTKHMRQMR